VSVQIAKALWQARRPIAYVPSTQWARAELDLTEGICLDDPFDRTIRRLQQYSIRENVMEAVKIGSETVGDGYPCYLIAEIGINHNGDVDIAKKLIEMAEAVGCNAVKFQKRTIDVVYTPEELAKTRENPFGPTNGDLKRGLEFGVEQYKEIDRYCREVGITWFASCWDEHSVDFIDQFNPPCYKIASACLTDDSLLRYHRTKGKPIILSTGMSTLEEVDHAVAVLGKKDLIILQATSTYPSNYDELDLRVIPEFRRRYGVPVGYSGHETGIPSSTAAVAMGACIVERHITLERAMTGSDHAASLGPSGIARLVRDIRLVEMSMGGCVKRVFEQEKPIIKKLRRVGAHL
jgi:N-acetylneuraminate synthase